MSLNSNRIAVKSRETVARLGIEPLEPRLLLASSPLHLARVGPTIRFMNPSGENEPLFSSGPIGFTPSQIRHAYGIDNIVFGGITGDGTGQTIAIVDAFNNPKFVSSSDPNYSTSDLFKFNAQFGLPQFGTPGGPTFTKVNQNGGTTYPANNSIWASEIALDVEWSHALAPKANIVLVEANSNFTGDLMSAAVGYARTVPGVSVVSMSFGSPEFAGESFYDSVFTTPGGHAGITFVAASGDDGAPGLYPSYSPNVLAVGGTFLQLSGGNYSSESGWSGSGGGISTQQSKPAYQSGLSLSATQRTIPDVAFDAHPASGVAVYDSFNGGSATPWDQIGGTSFSAPAWGALIAIANQGRANLGQGTLNGRNETLPKLYTMSASNFHDITFGNNGFSATPGYDLVTGLGTARADLLVPALVDAIVSVPDLTNGSDSGPSNSDDITNVTLPTFAGTTLLSGTVEILSDGVVVGSGPAVSGNYSITISTPLTNGTHVITSRINGNSSSTGLPLAIDTVAPSYQGSSFTYNTLPQKVTFAFNEDVSPSLTTSDLTVSNLTTSQNIPAGNMNVAYDLPTNVATLTFPGTFYVVPSGNYTITASASSITDIAGNPISGGISFGFYFLLGDSNHDGRVDVADLGILASNWQQSPRDFSQGDNDYGGLVNVSDLGVLASNWQVNLFPSPAPSAPLHSPLSGIFSDTSIATVLPRSMLESVASLLQLPTPARSLVSVR